MQSAASREAFAAWDRATVETMTARMHVRSIERQLREARKVLKATQAEEDSLYREFEATPYTDERAA